MRFKILISNHFSLGNFVLSISWLHLTRKQSVGADILWTNCHVPIINWVFNLFRFATRKSYLIQVIWMEFWQRVPGKLLT